MSSDGIGFIKRLSVEGEAVSRTMTIRLPGSGMYSDPGVLVLTENGNIYVGRNGQLDQVPRSSSEYPYFMAVAETENPHPPETRGLKEPLQGMSSQLHSTGRCPSLPKGYDIF
jgi:hypothetical protein